MKTLKDKHDREVKEAVGDAHFIRQATGYSNGFLRFHGSCDSSERAKERIKWVKEAEAQFLKDHQKEILEIAARLCEEYAGIGEDE